MYGTYDSTYRGPRVAYDFSPRSVCYTDGVAIRKVSAHVLDKRYYSYIGFPIVFVEPDGEVHARMLFATVGTRARANTCEQQYGVAIGVKVSSSSRTQKKKIKKKITPLHRKANPGRDIIIIIHDITTIRCQGDATQMHRCNVGVRQRSNRCDSRRPNTRARVRD